MNCYGRELSETLGKIGEKLTPGDRELSIEKSPLRQGR